MQKWCRRRPSKATAHPWTRLAGTEAAKLSFRVRLFIEGVPHHARQAPVLRQLLPQGSLLECIDFTAHNDSEASCCCVIAWSRCPDDFALKGVLRLEELQDRPRAAWHADAAATDA
jgi:hypothetical protein